MGAVVLVVSTSTAGAATANTLYVSRPHGSNANPCSASAPCQTIAFAVGKARGGDTIIVEKGLYHQYVAVKKRLRIIGIGGPVDDLRGRNNGFNIAGPKAAGTVISGFTIEHATFEGIIAVRTSRVTISNNVVKDNDLGVHAKTPTGECAPFGGGPGDCGEGIHLLSVTDSKVTRNLVTGDTGGILLTDEKGPTARNLVSHNISLRNVLDCGITLAGHSPKALSSTGKPQAKAAGVFGNTITDNVANGNGTKGEGAGIVLAAGVPNGGVYDNLIKGNTANDNGLAGITIHSHDFGPKAPPADLNGNKILDNKVSHDGLDAKSEAEFGGADFATGNTVGILVGSGKVKLTGIVITGNVISNAHFGIYTKNAPSVSPTANTFRKVVVPVKQI
jgi:nitrous oxidase accessory protein NosD